MVTPTIVSRANPLGRRHQPRDATKTTDYRKSRAMRLPLCDQQGGCIPLLQTTEEPAGGTMIVCFGGGAELLKLRQPASASGKSRINVVTLIL
jgi:hypothetical protein